MIDDVRSSLGRPDLTVSRLVWALIEADDAFSDQERDVGWARFYAERFVVRL